MAYLLSNTVKVEVQNNKTFVNESGDEYKNTKPIIGWNKFEKGQIASNLQIV